MTEWHRFLLGLIAASIYVGLIGMKILQVTKADPGNRKVRWRMIRFDVIRLFTDGTLLVGFLISPLCPAWFSLFHETALGYCTGCFELISITLLISAFVDWFPYHRSLHHSTDEKTSFSRFLLKQIINICQIEFALVLIWCVFLILEPTKISLLVKIGLSALVLLLLRGVLRLARGSRNKTDKQEKPE